MTMIAAVRYGNEGCIISDFRLTNMDTGDQFDVAQKFAFIDNRIALFMAGTVFYLTDITNKMNSITNIITFENFDNEKGPFVGELVSVFNSKQGGSSSIIGVMLDENKKMFKMLRFDATYVNGEWQYSLVADRDFNWQVIGSGAVVADSSFYPGRNVFSLQDIFRTVLDKGYDLYSAGSAIENEVEIRLKMLGTDVYRKLGISPVMNLTLISESALKVIGRTIEGGSVGNGVQEQWSYSYERQPSGDVILKDEKSGQVVKVHQTLRGKFPMETLQTPTRFDPELLEGSSHSYPKYTLSQWDVTHSGENTILIRYIHETVYKKWGGYNFPIRSIVHAEEKVFEQALSLQPNINNYKITENFTGDFESVRLFDNDWLENNLEEGHPFTVNCI
ncbi:hypothetical protein [Bacillus sp. m3-13]|uniref:hypothetical protein n=1 Tax=Bacillus sp. m3-13 TaxID=406124 RepID=UPI0001E89DA8|nr:hypothetical protein [Bacillus sp. m3-13]